MCGYDHNYLKDPAAASQVSNIQTFEDKNVGYPCVCVCVVQGSQKLLHWTAQDVKNWLWNINLDEYVAALDNAGLHGALMVNMYCSCSIWCMACVIMTTSSVDCCTYLITITVEFFCKDTMKLRQSRHLLFP